MKSQSDSYASAGVDITAGYKAVELMKSHIARTTTEGVFSPTWPAWKSRSWSPEQTASAQSCASHS